LIRFSRVRSDVVLWTESAFIVFAAYFVVTSLGGLTVLLWSHPRSLRDALRDRPTLWVLLAPPLLFIASAGLEVPAMIAFLIPFWLIATAGWSRTHSGSLLVPSILASIMTILTQHPWRRATDVTYFTDWFPYSVHAARVSGVTMSDAMLIDIWRLRMFIAAAGIAAMAAWWRRTVRPS
jgi:hypothetical protein